MNTKVNFRFVLLLLFLVLIIIVLSTILLITYKIDIGFIKYDVFWGLAAGLFTFALTFYFTQRFLYSTSDQILEKIEDLSREFQSHKSSTQSIINVLQREYKTVERYDRNNLLGRGFYDNLFKDSIEIKVLGITLLKFIEALVSESKEHTIINQLLNSDNIRIMILLLNPNSNFVKLLDKQEGTDDNPNPVSKKIKNVLSMLDKFSKLNSDKRTKNENKLQVRLTNENITLTFSYIKKKKENDPEDILHIGLLFGQIGQIEGAPLYNFPKILSDDIYNDSANYFNYLFKNAKSYQVFSWDNEGKHFNNNLIYENTI
jgi:hypothetical protein